MKFRKKPVVIEAQQYDGQRIAGVCQGECLPSWRPEYGHAAPHIHTLEGDHSVSPGDWVITGIKGELYPCKPDIFEATYERVEA